MVVKKTPKKEKTPDEGSDKSLKTIKESTCPNFFSLLYNHNHILMSANS